MSKVFSPAGCNQEIYSKISHFHLLTQPLAEALPGGNGQSKPDEQRSPAQASQAPWTRWLREQACEAAQPAEMREELYHSWGSASGGTAVCRPDMLCSSCAAYILYSSTTGYWYSYCLKNYSQIHHAEVWKEQRRITGFHTSHPSSPQNRSTLQTQERYVLQYIKLEILKEY